DGGGGGVTEDTGTARSRQDGTAGDGSGHDESAGAAAPSGGKGRRGADPRSWRGVAAETADELSAPIEALLRKRSRRLLGDLLRPPRPALTQTAPAPLLPSPASLA